MHKQHVQLWYMYVNRHPSIDKRAHTCTKYTFTFFQYECEYYQIHIHIVYSFLKRDQEGNIRKRKRIYSPTHS